MISDFTLPSNPAINIRMHEATVADALDFSETNDGMEEAVTTAFLDRVQDKACYSDPKTWTGEDRRFALFWYWLHTSEDTSPALTFRCSVCGEKHTVAIDLRCLVDGYKAIKGKAERDREFKGETITVRPLNGEALEAIELIYIDLVSTPAGSARANLLKARIKLMQLMHSVEFPGERDQENPLKWRENKLLGLTTREVASLFDIAESAKHEMVHGLSSEYDQGRLWLVTDPVNCQKETQGQTSREVGTRLRVPFRNYDYIPTL